MSNASGYKLIVAALLASGLVLPQTAPDNTGVNKRDRQKNAKTADQQKENTADRETTRKIRGALLDDKSLSTYAHNIKVITTDGVVTLKGPVRSAGEKKAVEAKAAEAVGTSANIQVRSPSNPELAAGVGLTRAKIRNEDNNHARQEHSCIRYFPDSCSRGERR